VTERRPADQAVMLAEFSALRAEILQRTQQQQALVALDLTVVGTIAGFVISGRADPELLLVAAVISAMMGLLWLDHHISIMRMGRYIDELWRWTPSWEAFLREERHEVSWQIVFWSAIVTVFLGGSVACLVVGHPGGHANAALWVLWAAGVLLALGLAAMYRRALRA